MHNCSHLPSSIRSASKLKLRISRVVCFPERHGNAQKYYTLFIVYWGKGGFSGRGWWVHSVLNAVASNGFKRRLFPPTPLENLIASDISVSLNLVMLPLQSKSKLLSGVSPKQERKNFSRSYWKMHFQFLSCFPSETLLWSPVAFVLNSSICCM